MIQLKMNLGQIILIQNMNSGVFSKGFPSQKPNVFENCDPPAGLVCDAQRANANQQKPAAWSSSLGPQDRRSSLEAENSPTRTLVVLCKWNNDKLSQTPMFRQSLPIQLGKNLPQQKKNTDLKPLQTPGLSFTSQIHRPTGSHVRYIYLHVPQYQPSMQIDQPSLEQATFSKVTNHSNALIIYPDLCAISRQFQVMRSLSWFIIYRRCARCPGSIKIFRVGYLRYFHGNLRAPTSSLGGIIKIDQKIHENPKNMAWTNWCLCQHKIASNFTLEAFQARFFFKVASKHYSHPRFTAHISHKLKHQRCFVSWLKKHPSFHRHGAWKFLLFQIGFWLKKCQETFFLVSTHNTGDMYFKKIARNQFTSLVMWGVSRTSWDL